MYPQGEAAAKDGLDLTLAEDALDADENRLFGGELLPWHTDATVASWPKLLSNAFLARRFFGDILENAREIACDHLLLPRSDSSARSSDSPSR
jgi:hypothetical protein